MSVALNHQNTTPLVELKVPRPISCDSTDWHPGSVIPPHHHNVDQLIYAATGVITVETEDGIWVVPPTRAVWVPANTDHTIRVSGHVQLRTIQFAPDLAPIASDECHVVHISQLLRECIFRAAEFPDKYGKPSPEYHVAQVVVDEVRSADYAPLKLPMPNDSRARKVALAFCEDLANRRTCKEWASSAGASERTLERLFTAETGMSFGKWQQQARLLGALERLASGETVTSTAYDLGFSSPSAFIVMFKSTMGETPSRYFQID